MRLVIVFFFVLPACSSHAIRCDRHLRPINAPVAGAAEPAAPRSAP
jgi:hypothetical protein